MRAYSRVAVCVALAALPACADSLPRPKIVDPPDSAYEIVPYPPPAALSELVPDPPKGNDIVWIDGSWVFRGNYYVWNRGGWVDVPEGALYAQWKVRYSPDGRVEYAPSSWRDDKGKRARVRVSKPASSPPNEVTAEFQTGR